MIPMIQQVDGCTCSYSEKGSNRKQVLTYDGKSYEDGLPDMEWKDGQIVG